MNIIHEEKYFQLKGILMEANIFGRCLAVEILDENDNQVDLQNIIKDFHGDERDVERAKENMSEMLKEWHGKLYA